jgi:hypothetical protein
MFPPPVPLSKLLPIAILSDGDFYDLAALMLRGLDALPRDTKYPKRPLVFSVASTFVKIFPEVDIRTIVNKLQEMGFDLEKSIEWDEGPIPTRSVRHG